MTTPRPHSDDELQAQFDALRTPPPDNLADRILTALPDRPGPARLRLLARWPGPGRWLVPALAGAAAAMVLMSALWAYQARPGATEAGVTFVVHAPAAEQVELVGSFNAWMPGQILLTGPDSTGRWMVTVPLPEGRHEYLFLVDGKQWMTDPGASFHRPDGFGRHNAVIDVGSKDAG